MKTVKNLIVIVMCAMALSTTTLNAQNVITLESGGNAYFFNNIDDAVSVANPGDYIYIPGGEWHINNRIETGVNFVGVGYNPDSASATGITKIMGGAEYGDVVITTHGADGQNPGFQIHGLDEFVQDATAKVIADATAHLTDKVTPALEQALKNSLHEAKAPLKGAIKEGLAEAVPPILLSTVGLLVTSAGIMLMYQGLKADSIQDDETSSKKVNTAKLYGYGSALIIIGITTIMHTSIRNFFSGQKP